MVEIYLKCEHSPRGPVVGELSIKINALNGKLNYLIAKKNIIIQTKKRGLVKLESIEENKEFSLIGILPARKKKIHYFKVPNSEIVEYYSSKELYPN